MRPAMPRWALSHGSDAPRPRLEAAECAPWEVEGSHGAGSSGAHLHARCICAALAPPHDVLLALPLCRRDAPPGAAAAQRELVSPDLFGARGAASSAAKAPAEPRSAGAGAFLMLGRARAGAECCCSRCHRQRCVTAPNPGAVVHPASCSRLHLSCSPHPACAATLAAPVPPQPAPPRPRTGPSLSPQLAPAAPSVSGVGAPPSQPSASARRLHDAAQQRQQQQPAAQPQQAPVRRRLRRRPHRRRRRASIVPSTSRAAPHLDAAAAVPPALVAAPLSARRSVQRASSLRRRR